MARLETNGYYALGVPLYVALAALEIWIARRRKLASYGVANTLGNLSAGLGEVVIGLFLGPLLLALYDLGYRHLALLHYSKDLRSSLLEWLLAFLLGDLCYYLYHRAGHTIAALWAIHGVHHQSERFNLSIALRHPWLSDSYSFVFYIPLPLLGVAPEKFFIAITLISFYALTIHSHLFARPAFWVFVTPATHVIHHAKNPRYLNKNYGALLNVWDRMFGTYCELDPAEPVILGTPFGYQTHDGALSQWVLFKQLLATAKQAQTSSDKLKVLIKYPGWRPKYLKPFIPKLARAESTIPNAVRIYAVIQFTLITLLALHVLWLRDSHPRWLLVSASLIILFALSTIGGLLDGRAHSDRFELLRLLATSLLGAAMFLATSHPVTGLFVLSASLASTIALVTTSSSKFEPERGES